MDNQSSQPIVENSLTELAFIFFFILLIFSSWKVNDLNESIDEQQSENTSLKKDISNLESTLDEAVRLKSFRSVIDTKALITDLTFSKEQAKKVPALQKENKKLTDSLEMYESVMSDNFSDEVDLKVIMDSLEQLDEISKLLDEAKKNDESENKRDLEKNSELKDSTSQSDRTLSEEIESLMQRQKDILGQNVNLRNKLKKVGNGLDHPPCWAHPDTGAIEYLYDVIINEESLEFLPGWPQSRDAQAMNDNNILMILGQYKTNKDLWGKSIEIYRDSVALSCRHFVRIYDHALSKHSFKSYLLGIESHFYKLLMRSEYAR